MIFNKPHKSILFPVFLLLTFFSFGQGKIAISSGVDKNNIVIGEQVHFTLQAYFPSHEPIRFFTIDSIPHFEILERKKIDTSANNEGIELKQVLTLTSFDSGHWVLPAFEITGEIPLYTDTIPMNVGFSAFDPNQDYHNIKDVLDVQPEEKKKKDWYWYVAVTAVLVAAILYMLMRRKKQPPAANLPPVDPYLEAKRELEKLQKENPPSKIFYTGLVDIFRLYILRRKKIESLQKTTDDLVVQLRSLKLSSEDLTHLAQVFRMSDFVKFAKYQPSEEDKRHSFDVVKNSIEIIEKFHPPSTGGG